MTALKIIEPGLRATLQDQGRRHSQHLGLAPGGAADLHAWRWANKLLDNPTDAACIEVLMGQFRAVAVAPLTIAITGAETDIHINGKQVGNWRSHHLNIDDELSLGQTRAGLLNYVAVAGGWQTPSFCNSRSMTPRERLPGFTLIEKEASLAAAEVSKRPVLQVPPKFVPDYGDPLTLRVVPGYQHQAFGQAVRATFVEQTYTVSDRIDRMGYRLSGLKIDSPDIKLLSEGIAQGAVQIPADGQPIVLLNDRQTMGGYPKIGTVAALDCSRLCQRGPGSEIRFSFADLADIQSERMVFEAFFEQSEWTASGELRWL